jgi:hypothetical protein
MTNNNRITSPAQRLVMPITAADKDAFDRMPDDGWFRPQDLPYQIRNPFHRCKRLLAHALLESRVQGDIPDVWSEYRKRVPFI